MEKKEKTYFVYLDALRCIAFLLVFYAHTGTVLAGGVITSPFLTQFWTRFTIYGAYGVNFFFVLSGFLITLLLLKEKETKGSISIKNFYMKRVLRIWPVYFITLFVGAFILPAIITSETYSVFNFTNPNMSWETITYFLFFVGNFYQGMDIGMASLAVGILWSVCVEEQFYLVWPWIVKWFKTRQIIIITIFLISLSLLYKLIFADHRTSNYYLPWSVGMDLAFGALLASFYFLRKQKVILIYSWSIIVGSIIFIIATVATTAIGTYSTGTDIISIKESLIRIVRLVKTPIVDCVFTLILLYFINSTASIRSEMNHPILAFFHQTRRKTEQVLIYLGKISYGLYAYHAICLILSVHILYSLEILDKDITLGSFIINTIFGFLLTFLVAHFSSNFIEKKILVYKSRWD